MIQRHIQHKPNRFADCGGCHHQPLHIQCKGRTTAEASSPNQPAAGERHRLECPRCNNATSLNNHLRGAVMEWNTTYAVPATQRAA